MVIKKMIQKLIYPKILVLYSKQKKNWQKRFCSTLLILFQPNLLCEIGSNFCIINFSTITVQIVQICNISKVCESKVFFYNN